MSLRSAIGWAALWGLIGFFGVLGVGATILKWIVLYEAAQRFLQ